MSKIEGNEANVSALATPSYDFNPEKTAAAASVIKIFNSIKDVCDTQTNCTDFTHQIDRDCSEFKGLCEYLLDQTPNQKPTKESSTNSDIIDLLLSHITLTTQCSTDECLKALHQFKQVLSKSEVIGKIENTFNKNKMI